MEVNSFIDHLSGLHDISNYDDWKHHVYEETGKEFGYSVGDVTGKRLYNADKEKSLISWDSFEFNYWTLTRIRTVDKETGEVTYKLKISGCPPKIYYGGNNLSNIPHDDFCKILKDFESMFLIPLDQIRIAAPTEVSGTFFFEGMIKERVILFQFKRPFEPTYNSDNELLGYEAENAHDDAKIYLPSLKFRQELNKIRIERRWKKIPNFRRDTGILTWADLLAESAMYECYKMVLATWKDDTIVYDPKLKAHSKYHPLINEIIKHGYKADYWTHEFLKKVSTYKAKKYIEEYNRLAEKRDEGVYHKVLQAILEEGKKFQFVSSLLSGNKLKNNNSISINIDNKLINKEEGKENESTEYRNCLSCNRDISNQRSTSKFCSTKYVGEQQAKQCRNKDSNARNNSKRKRKNDAVIISGNSTVIPAPAQKSKLKELLEKLKVKYAAAG